MTALASFLRVLPLLPSLSDSEEWEQGPWEGQPPGRSKPPDLQLRVGVGNTKLFNLAYRTADLLYTESARHKIT